MKKNYGFTLAEVLITLGIIGVVAAITIPTLISNKAKQEHVVKVKKIYSTLEQAVRMSEAENGNKATWSYGVASYTSGAEAVAFTKTYLIPYLNVAKNCETTTGCWVTKIKHFDGTDFNNYGDNGQYAKFILNDGTALHVSTAPGTAFIHFDVNGPAKGPNIYGQDILTYSINYDNSIYGMTQTRAQLTNPGLANSCTKTTDQPDLCLILIMKDGWQIADDYPWK